MGNRFGRITTRQCHCGGFGSGGQDRDDLAGLTDAVQLYTNTPEPLYLRSDEEALRLFAGFDLVEPGLVGCALWQPSGSGDISNSAQMNTVSYGGAGRKP